VQDTLSSVAGVDQPMRVAGLAFGPAETLQWGVSERSVDFFDAKGDVEALLGSKRPTFVPDVHPAMHPGRCARIEVEGRAVGHVGELHPKWRQAWDLAQAPVLFELDLDAVLQRAVPQFVPLPRQQSAVRDLALVVGEGVSHDVLMSALSADTSGLVRSARLFDIYKPAPGTSGFQPGERSLAIRLELLDDDTTLTDERIDAAVAAALQRAAQVCGARLRS
jgi:phenylalanyl-tRNA synthetase beta chain